MSAPSITDPAATARPASRRRSRARLRTVPDVTAPPGGAPPAAPAESVDPPISHPGATAAPSTAASSTAAPSTAASSTAAPPTTVPSTVASSIAAPSTVAPSAMAPSTAAPLTVAPSNPAPLTVTISVDGGAPEARDRLRAVLQDLVAAAGREFVPVAGDAAPAHGEPGVVHVDPEPRAAFRDGRLLDLSRLEYDLLLFFARHPRQVFSRGQLLAEVWGHLHTGARTVDVHVSRLRQKLGRPELIATVYGVGYRLADAAPVRVVPPRTGGVSWTA